MNTKKVKRCIFCGTYFKPDPRTAHKQECCGKEKCKRKSKTLSQRKWLNKNLDYFKDTYPDTDEHRKKYREYMREYRKRKKKSVNKDEIHIKIPRQYSVFILPDRDVRGVKKDEIVLRREAGNVFRATG